MLFTTSILNISQPNGFTFVVSLYHNTTWVCQENLRTSPLIQCKMFTFLKSGPDMLSNTVRIVDRNLLNEAKEGRGIRSPKIKQYFILEIGLI